MQLLLILTRTKIGQIGQRGDKCMLTKEDIKYMEKMGLDLDFNKPLSKENYEQLGDMLSHQLQVYGLDKK